MNPAERDKFLEAIQQATTVFKERDLAMRADLAERRKLIPCRARALMEASELKTKVFSGKYRDLLAFYKGQWHYITTTLV